MAFSFILAKNGKYNSVNSYAMTSIRSVENHSNSFRSITDNPFSIGQITNNPLVNFLIFLLSVCSFQIPKKKADKIKKREAEKQENFLVYISKNCILCICYTFYYLLC